MVQLRLDSVNTVAFINTSHLSIDTHRAAASVATGVSRTLADLDLTAGTRVSRQTGTSVAALASVGTGGSVKTRLVVCAVVQICKHPRGATFMNNAA